MHRLDLKAGDSFFFGMSKESARNMTLGELLDNEAFEIKIMDIAEQRVYLSIDIPHEISIIHSDFTDKQHGSNFPPHRPIQQGD